MKSPASRAVGLSSGGGQGILADVTRDSDVAFPAGLLFIALLTCITTAGCRPNTEDFVRVRSSRVALRNVSVVDGTGSPVKDNQTVVIDHGRIAAAGPAGETPVPPDAQTLDLAGYTVIPGLVGMHDHLFYAADGGRQYISLPRSFAHLYLAAGVTSLRTAGAIELQKDIAIKREIDEGREVGPKIHLSSPYLGAAPDIATLVRLIDTAADAGVTSLKAYTTLRRDELAAVIGVAHRRGLTVTGHLCAVGFREAASLGIDSLEHGLLVDTEFHPGKVDDQCPSWAVTASELAGVNIDSEPIQETIRQLVSRRVAITSTLAVFESFFPVPASIDPRVALLLTRSARRDFEREVTRHRADERQFTGWQLLLHTEMAFERSFVRAGGRLMAGADPTGWGGVLAGLADQRNIELLVEAGFSPEEAIQIATANGADSLGQSAKIGTVTPGKQADLVVLRGQLASDIRSIRNVEIVFKDGVGFDSAALMRAEHGKIGLTNWRLWLFAGIFTVLLLLLYFHARLTGSRSSRR
jgi:imidazolonepropionase-like amidohydrolase